MDAGAQHTGEEQSAREFVDPAREGRRVFAETWGTFLLVLVAAGGDVVSAVSGGQAFAMETVLTAGLVNTILGTASGARNIGANGAMAVGGYIALAGLWAAPISGASMNPVRSFAPDLLRGDLHTTWIYVAGPVTGAVIGVAFEWILRGKPTAAGGIAAQGTPSGD